MGRPPKHGQPMTNAQRQAARWDRLRRIEVAAAEAVADLAAALIEPTTEAYVRQVAGQVRKKLQLAGGWLDDKASE